MGIYTGTPPTFTAGETLTAAKLNQLRDLGRGFTDPWEAYTPTLTASTTNPTNWTAEGYYTRVGTLAVAKFYFVAGASMTAGSGQYRFGLPANAASSLAWVPMGELIIRDSSSGNQAMLRLRLNNTVPGYVFSEYPTSWPAGPVTSVGAAAPWAWAAGDEIRGLVIYEAATA